MKEHILVVGLNAVIQKTIVLPDFSEDSVIRAESYIEDAAGKATNVCRVLTQLGVSSSCLTPLGNSNRDEFLALAEKDGLTIVPVANHVRVRNCYTLVNRKNGNATEIIVDEKEPISVEVENETLKVFYDTVASADILVITGSKAKGYSDGIIPAMVARAKDAGVMVFADYREADLRNSFKDAVHKPDYVKINIHEFVTTFCPEKDATQAASLLKKEIQAVVEKYQTTFIITAGSKETIYAAPGGEFGIYHPPVIKPINAIGCGDTFLAGLVHGIIDEKSLDESVRYASELAVKNALHLRPGSIE